MGGNFANFGDRQIFHGLDDNCCLQAQTGDELGFQNALRTRHVNVNVSSLRTAFLSLMSNSRPFFLSSSSLRMIGTRKEPFDGGVGFLHPQHRRGIGQQDGAQGRDRGEQNDGEAAIGDEHQERQCGEADQEAHNRP